MVTKEELSARKFTKKSDAKASAFVTAAEMRRFEGNRRLPDMVYNKVTAYAKENNIKNKYESIIEICQISDTSLKRSCNGSQKITRTFLYKFTVGLKMSVEEANEYFMLCGGALSSDCLEDYICIRALECKDDILLFIGQFNQYLKEHDGFQTGDKLKIITQ